ncbi:MFS transporter [Trinickia dinghuensis]|uniref:MFS transporter n=1 Tax=Trinickia dinghuensis TaxID=2291023 RepID=UPI0015F18600|nr:MFS transporter [Trinickia dinghuensis]
MCLIPFQLMFGMVYAWGGIAPVIQHETGWSIASLDLMFSLTPLTLFPAVLAGGRLVGRYPPERVLMLAWLCFVAGTLSGLSSHSPWMFAVCYACVALGVGGGLSTPASIEIIRRQASRASGRFSGALLAVYCFSATVSVPLFLWFAQRQSWRYALGATAAAWCIPGGIALLTLRGGPARAVAPEGAAQSQAYGPALRAVAWNIGLLFACVPFGSAVFAALGRLAVGHGAGTWSAVAGTAAISLANGTGRFGGGVFSDFLTPRATWCAMLGLAAGAYLAALADAFLKLPVSFIVFAALTGLAFGSAVGMLPALAARTGVAEPATVFSLYFGAFALASFAGPLVSAAAGIATTMTVFGSLTLVAFGVSAVRLGASRLRPAPSNLRRHEHGGVAEHVHAEQQGSSGR